MYVLTRWSNRFGTVQTGVPSLFCKLEANIIHVLPPPLSTSSSSHPRALAPLLSTRLFQPFFLQSSAKLRHASPTFTRCATQAAVSGPRASYSQSCIDLRNQRPLACFCNLPCGACPPAGHRNSWFDPLTSSIVPQQKAWSKSVGSALSTGQGPSIAGYGARQAKFQRVGQSWLSIASVVPPAVGLVGTGALSGFGRGRIVCRL
ncbi:hypothetical protein B0J12DRAFT_68450 [Macrophomina phaseolina]|uniref:Uncharacterized protein n=1 Tax=Macrophomina phaseolina TaxID=35725 RepID=A0ABQ8GDP8_9PEZI|nr:hypothetical protein B0J12DRAFT_68450 [Macrophomina phaseolina]